jgi:predicted nucleotidyltransferase
MAKLTVDDFAREVARALGDRLVTLLLYGSAARGAHVPERSDVNTLLLCDAVDDDLFARLEPPVRAWTRAGHLAPLILTEREWRESAEAFPIEYQDIRDAHRILAGRDPWKGIAVQRDHLRRQLEHELMGKLVHLRQAYAAQRSEPKRLAQVIVGSAGGFLTMLRAALRLAGKTAPGTPGALVRDAGGEMGFAAAGLAPLVAHASGGPALKLAAHDPLPAAYLEAVARTAQYVNRMERTHS